MRKFGIAVSLAFLALGAFAQSVDLDRFHAKYAYRDLPSNPLPKDMRSYSVKANFCASVSDCYSKEEYEKNAIQIVGLERKTEGAGLQVSYTFSPIEIKEINVAEIKHEDKDKDGNVVKVYYTYRGIMKYVMSSSVKFVDNTGKVLYSNNLNSTMFVKEYQSDEYSEYKNAASYIKLNKELIINKITASAIASDNKEVTSTANALFGYPETSDNVLFWYLGSEKHPEFAAHKENFEKVKAAIEAMSANGGVAQARDMVKPLIAYLEDAKTRYTEDNKKHRKMRYASFFNLAQIYLLVEMPDEAIKQAEGLIANDYDTGDGKDFIKKANKLKKSFEQNGLDTRHFALN